jgi:hypothetical protein
MLELVCATSRLDAKTQAPPVHALNGLLQLTRSRVGIIAHVHRRPHHGLQINSFVDIGWNSDTGDRDSLIRAALEPGYVDPVLEHGFQKFEEQSERPTSFRRDSFFSDNDWYSSPCFANHRKPARIDDCVYSIFYLGKAGHYACLGLHRGAGDRVRYSERERQLADYVWQSLGWMHQLPLAPHSNPEPSILNPALSSLPQDLLTTLNLLKSRSSLTRAHAKLGLTRSNFQRNIRRVYTHFNVSSRLELLTRLLDDTHD